MSNRILENRARYNRMAASYAAMVRLGVFSWFYRKVAGAIDAVPGGTLLDVGCGPGTLVPHLLPKIEPGGRVIGADVSDRMIERARALAADRGWQNVRFERCDIWEFDPGTQADVVVFCLALSGMPEPERVLVRALSWLRPGGQLVVLDSFLEPDRRLAALVIRLKSPLVGADPAALTLDSVTSKLASPHIQRFQGGTYTLVSGRKPPSIP
jgi:ubiquinone/menaquinone biosynthesis C-methylase UbiE